jgi:hypothetical protein
MHLDKQIWYTKEDFNKWVQKNFPHRYDEDVYDDPADSEYPVYFRGYHYSEYNDHSQIYLVYFPIAEISEYLGE